MNAHAERRPLVVFHNDVFGEQPWARPGAGDFGCDVTTDRARVPEADAVVLHVPTFGRRRHIAKHPANLWVLWSMESVVNYPLMADPAALRHFDLRMTYERDADVWVPYLPSLGDVSFAMAGPLPPKPEAAPVALFQSAPIDRCGRYPFAAELMRHVRVDSFGKQLNNRALPWQDLGGPTKRVVISRYKFTLALENSVAPDYVTEKFFDPLLAGCVPVYRGAPNVAAFAPGPKSYIDASDFRSPKDLADYLNFLSGNDEAYREYFAWRQNPAPAFIAALRSLEEPSLVRLGKAVRRALAERSSKPRRTIYPFSRVRRVWSKLRPAPL